MASIMRPMSEAFLPGVLFICMMGSSEYVADCLSHGRRRSCDQSPYMRRIVILPYLDSRLNMLDMYFALTLSESMSRAMLIFLSSSFSIVLRPFQKYTNKVKWGLLHGHIAVSLSSGQTPCPMTHMLVV